MSRFINNLANYHGGIVPNVKQHQMQKADSDASKSKSGCLPKKKRAAAAAGKKAVCVLYLIKVIIRIVKFLT